MKKIVLLFVLSAVYQSVFAQPSLEKELAWLQHPKGWKMVSMVDVYWIRIEDHPVADIMNQLSPCTKSGIFVFKTNGTYTEVFPVKSCPDERITDNTGTWTIRKDEKVRPGIVHLALQDSKIIHYWRGLQIIAMDETTLFVALNASPQSWNQRLVTFKRADVAGKN